jgi:hypothetical protein
LTLCRVVDDDLGRGGAATQVVRRAFLSDLHGGGW